MAEPFPAEQPTLIGRLIEASARNTPPMTAPSETML